MSWTGHDDEPQRARHLPAELVERSVAMLPLPIADAVAALAAADGPHEERDRIVEVFRAISRVLAALALATRLHVGPGPDEAPAEVGEALRLLRRRRLTDGQWLSLTRGILRGWASSPRAHPLPLLVELFVGASRAPMLLDELLAMRRAETVAHGGTGDEAEVDVVIGRRMPQLAALLAAIEPMFAELRIVVPSAEPRADAETQGARLLMGSTPPRGRFRRLELSPGARAEEGAPIVVDARGRPLVALSPLLELRRATPGAIEELFFLDGATRSGAAYLALPSMAEHVDRGAWGRLERALLGDGEDEAEAPARAERPYRGLERFEPEHADLFFGREEEAEALANRIRRVPLLTVTGPSGSGKSSLVAAGVLPRLSDHAHVIVRPGASPTAALARRLVERLGEETDEEAVRDTIRRRPDVAATALARWCDEHRTSLVLVVDQAEELLTLASSSTDCLAFAAMIAAAASDPEGPLRVVLIVREDFFARLSALAPLRGLYTRAVDVVTTPDREALVRAVVLPAARFGYVFEDPELVDAMVDAAAGEPAALALLSFCADSLWKSRDRRWRRIPREAYAAVGGVEGALAQHAEQTLEDLTPSQRACARTLLLRLVTPSMARAVVPREELLAAAGREVDARVVVERLVEARLLVAREGDPSGEGASLELVHEALLHHWARLRGWLLEDRERQARSASLREATRAWADRGRPRGLLLRDEILAELSSLADDGALGDAERDLLDASLADARRARRTRRTILAASLLLAIGLGAALFVAWRTAVRARLDAEAAGASAARALVASDVGRLVAEAGRRELSSRPAESLALLRAAASEADNPGPILAEIDRLASLGDIPRRLDLDGPVSHARIFGTGVLVVHGRFASTFDARGRETSRLDLGEPPIAAASGGGRLVVASRDRRLAIHGAIDERPIASLPLSRDAVSVAIAEDGARAAAGLVGGAVTIVDVASGDVSTTQILASTAIRVALSLDGSLAAAASTEGEVAIFDAKTLARLGSIPGTGGPLIGLEFAGSSLLFADRRGVKIWSSAERTSRELAPSGAAPIVFAAHGDRAIVARGDGTVMLHSLGARVVLRLPTSTRSLRRLAISGNGQVVAGATSDGVISVWDGASGARLRVVHAPWSTSSAISLDEEGRRLAVTEGGENGAIAWWSLDDATESRALAGHRDDIHALAFSPDGKRIATASRDHTVRLWALPAGAPIATLDHPDHVDAIAFSPNGASLATGAHDGRARLFRVADGALDRAFEPSGGYVPAVAFSPDGSFLAAGSVDRSLRVFDVVTGKIDRSLAGSGALVAVAFSRKGETIAAVGDDDAASFWSAKGSVTSLPVPGGYADAVTMSTSADLLAAGGLDGSALLARISTGERIARVFGHESAVLATALASDGKTLVTGSADQTARVWSVPDGALRARLEGHTGPVLAVAISEGRIATASADRSVRLWSTDGALIAVLGGHTEEVTAIAFSPDGRLLASGSRDDTTRVWNIEGPHDPSASARAAGERTNLRVCRESLAVVPVTPAPPPLSVWAPAASCR